MTYRFRNMDRMRRSNICLKVALAERTGENRGEAILEDIINERHILRVKEWTHSQRKRYTCDYYEMYRTEPQEKHNIPNLVKDS